MNDSDPQLRSLLHQWRDVEPSSTFEVDVRRRIRLAQPPARESRWAWLAPLATAAAVAVVVGTWTSRQAAPRFAPAPTTFLAGDSLAGSYLNLGGHRR